MLYFILLLLWSIAECKPMNKQQEGTTFLQNKREPQLEHIVQDLMQKHDNNNPTSSWEEEDVNAVNSRPCSNEEIINGINYDYYIQYVDMNENYARGYLEDIDHVDISEPALFRCRPVMYCAEEKNRPYVSAPRNQHNNVNRKDDCFVLTQNGKTPYSNIPHNKQHKHNTTENANNLQNKTNTAATLSIPQLSNNRAVSAQLPNDLRHMYISVHNNINMGRNEQIYSQTYKESSKEQSNTTANNTTPLQLSITKQTFVYNTTTEIPAEANAIVAMPNSKEFSSENKHSQEHSMHEEKQKSNMKILLDFLATFKKKLCNDSVPNNVGDNLTNTTDLIKITTETPAILSTDNKTLSDDAVIFVIHKNKNNTNDTSIHSGNNLVDIKPKSKPLTEPLQSLALKADNTDSKNNTKSLKERLSPKSHSKTAELDKENTNGNSELKSSEEYVGSLNVKNIPTARRRNNYGNAKTGYILRTEWNNGRPYYRKERIQPHYNHNTNYNRAGYIAKPQRSNSTPRTFYWNNVIRRRYGKANDNFQSTHRFKELPLENCNFESINQSKLDSIDCDQLTTEKSTESKDYREYMRPNFRRKYINYMKRYT